MIANTDRGTVITGLLRSTSERTRLETLIFIGDWLYGGPAQSVNVAAGLMRLAHDKASTGDLDE